MDIHACMPDAFLVACRQISAASKELLHSLESILRSSSSLPEVQVTELDCSAFGIVVGERPVLLLMTCHLQGRHCLLLLPLWRASATCFGW